VFKLRYVDLPPHLKAARKIAPVATGRGPLAPQRPPSPPAIKFEESEPEDFYTMQARLDKKVEENMAKILSTPMNYESRKERVQWLMEAKRHTGKK
jgi:hypothetical protein